MTFDIEQQIGRFVDIAGELSEIATQRQVSKQENDPDNNTATRLQAISLRVRALSAEVAEAVRIDMARHEGTREALAASKRKFRILAENLPIYLARYTPDARFAYMNARLEASIGYRTDEVTGRTPGQIWPDGSFDEYESCILRAAHTGDESQTELMVESRDGQPITYQVHFIAERDEAGTISVAAIGYDITEHRQAEAERQAQYERILQLNRRLAEKAAELSEAGVRLRGVLQTIPDLVWLKDADGVYLSCNHAFERLIGMREPEIIGKTDHELFDAELADFFREKDRAAVQARSICIYEEWVTYPDTAERTLFETRKVPVLDANGRVAGVLGVARDITELQASREKIHRMAYYDPLTALPNRASFNERLRQMILDGAGASRQACVMMIDMDRFKGINDTMGHAVGDQLLREAAERLSTCVRPCDIVARFGGDEFAILLSENYDRCMQEDISRTILGRFDERFVLNGKEVFVSCSIGIALYPVDSVNADDLMKYADSAMYSAKRSGGRSFRFYSKDLTASATADLLLESELRRAIEREEFELHYQPKVLVHDNEVIGSEALLRWHRPGVGLVPPSQFIPIAEETGLICDLGKWVLREACRTAAEWNVRGTAFHKVAVNLSARQFQFHGLAAMVDEILDETGCRPEWLELEITESLLLAEDGTILSALSALKSMGLSIAIDDFGTGYSSLGYLARFPIDTLKIDRSFVQQVTMDRRHAELVKAILSIAQCLGQQVVAEGVETAEQAAFLQANGCQVAQGFLYSKPLPKPAMVALPRYLKPDAAVARNVVNRYGEAPRPAHFGNVHESGNG